MLHSVLGLWGAIAQGNGPLSVESTFAEIIRLAQLGILAGIGYLVKILKENRSESKDTHQTILDDIRVIREEIRSVNSKVDVLEKK